MRIVFAGTPEISSTILQYILDCNFNVIACYTQPDRQKGRGQQVEASPVKLLAQKYNIPVFQPENFKALADCAQLQALQPDVMVVVAYGLILPSKILAIPPLGCLNIHASLLPQWRGASPITQAILAGDATTGVTIMQMDKGMDTGPILAMQTIVLDHTHTTQSLTDDLAEIGKIAIVKVLQELAQGIKLVPQEQEHSQATYAPKINKTDALLKWELPASRLERQIRAYNPWPVAFGFLNGENVRIWQAKVIKDSTSHTFGKILEITKHGVFVGTGEDILQITAMQFPSKKIMSAVDLFNYPKLKVGACFNNI